MAYFPFAAKPRAGKITVRRCIQTTMTSVFPWRRPLVSPPSLAALRAGNPGVTSEELALILRQERAREFKNSRTHYVDHPLFKERNAWSRFVTAPYPVGEGGNRQASDVALGVPEHLRIFTPEQERYLFLKMNFLFFCAERQIKKLSTKIPKEDSLYAIDSLLEDARAIKTRIIVVNERLVKRLITKRGVSPKFYDEAFAAACEGLLSAIENFDASTGTKFSTYASTCINNQLNDNYNRRKREGRESATEPETLDRLLPPSPAVVFELIQGEDRRALGRWCLSQIECPRTRKVLELRLGLDGGEPLTLREIGGILQCTAQRVQQLEKEAYKLLWERCGEFLKSQI